MWLGLLTFYFRLSAWRVPKKIFLGSSLACILFLPVSSNPTSLLLYFKASSSSLPPRRPMLFHLKSRPLKQWFLFNATARWLAPSCVIWLFLKSRNNNTWFIARPSQIALIPLSHKPSAFHSTRRLRTQVFFLRNCPNISAAPERMLLPFKLNLLIAWLSIKPRRSILLDSSLSKQSERLSSSKNRSSASAVAKALQSSGVRL